MRKIVDSWRQHLKALGTSPSLKSNRAIEPSIDMPALFAVTGLVCMTYLYGGFVGIGLLGLIIMFVAFQLELDRGILSMDCLTQRIPANGYDNVRRAQTSARLREIEAASRRIRLGRVFGLCLAAIGLGATLI